MNTPDSLINLPDQQPLPQAEQTQSHVIEIPVEGSLGLLALGARGIIAWREKRAEVAQQEGN